MTRKATDQNCPASWGERLKILPVLLPVLGVFVTGLMVLAWFMPAFLALALLAPGMHITQWQRAEGTLWHGRARYVRLSNGVNLAPLAWILPRHALLGEARLQGVWQPWGVRFSGRVCHPFSKEATWRTVHLQANLVNLKHFFQYARLKLYGKVDISIVDAQLAGIWPVKFHAIAQWKQAAVSQGKQRLPLGTFRLQADSAKGVLHLKLSDEALSPLQATGTASIGPLAWHYRVVLKPRKHDPVLTRYLTGLGPLSPDGTLILHDRGTFIPRFMSGQRP